MYGASRPHFALFQTQASARNGLFEKSDLRRHSQKLCNCGDHVSGRGGERKFSDVDGRHPLARGYRQWGPAPVRHPSQPTPPRTIPTPTDTENRSTSTPFSSRCSSSATPASTRSRPSGWPCSQRCDFVDLVQKMPSGSGFPTMVRPFRPEKSPISGFFPGLHLFCIDDGCQIRYSSIVGPVYSCLAGPHPRTLFPCPLSTCWDFPRYARRFVRPSSFWAPHWAS